MYFDILTTNSNQWREILTLIKHDIYQLPEYVALEGKRSNSIPQAFLAIDEQKIFFVPYLIRSCQNILKTDKEILDVISPYGYPGILLSEAAKEDHNFCGLALEKFRHSLQEQNICSAFFRLHPILNENWHNIFAADALFANGTTVSIDLKLPKEEIWSNTKSNHRNKINRCTKRFGLTTKITKLSQRLDVFCQLYEETMARVIAQDIYYSFNSEYFQQMDSEMSDRLYLCLVQSESGEPASAGLYTECGGIVQAAFGGISNNFVRQSPSILELDAMRWWAKEQGYQYLHLGGGVGGSEDSVYKFKAGFSKLRHPFYTLRLIIDQEKYDYLVDLKARSHNIAVDELKQSNFFPAYRAPLTVDMKQ
ncbi:FemAB family [Xenococcus sp. PCC 7305]|uniref:GNAT family N-acetyltransferase n=1 Tax=Xenococcus sp. PCC 7305 TaxID=102125 RepID=UPI0002AC877C|nr:GNAT family N-acetyltransferase [Xenococcus sp. PCC 7305]ELS03865.1 FemAB family [Xenococcus sp. PCC 7305]